MKDIHTLVEDIYNLFSPDELQMDEKEIDKDRDEFATNIKEHLKLFLNEKPRSRGNLRLSAIGKPDRQLWYDMYTTEDKIIPLSSSTRIKFLYGYILEELLIVLSRIAGHTVTDMQKEVSVEGVKGHQDCMIDNVLVDCKSASGRSFEKFEKARLERDDPFGYIAQISAYAEANDKDEAAFLYNPGKFLLLITSSRVSKVNPSSLYISTMNDPKNLSPSLAKYGARCSLTLL